MTGFFIFVVSSDSRWVFDVALRARHCKAFTYGDSVLDAPSRNLWGIGSD